MNLYELEPEVLYLNGIRHFTRMWLEKALARTRTLPLGPKGKKLYAYYTVHGYSRCEGKIQIYSQFSLTSHQLWNGLGLSSIF